ncbi:MAG: hypothetical protein U1F43_38365 [Myxococcota bacterium]
MDGACVARRLPGEPCDADHACVLGAACSSGTCRADAIVAVGDACDQTHDCPYKSACVASSRGGQRCVETHLLGEPCDDQVGCASGFCDGGTCAALGPAGAPCDGYAACTSGRCSVDTCAPITFSCVDNH